MADEMIKLETDHIEDFLPCEVERINYLVCDCETDEILAEVGSASMASVLVRLGTAAGGKLELVPCVRAKMARSHFLACKARLNEETN